MNFNSSPLLVNFIFYMQSKPYTTRQFYLRTVMPVHYQAILLMNCNASPLLSNLLMKCQASSWWGDLLTFIYISLVNRVGIFFKIIYTDCNQKKVMIKWQLLWNKTSWTCLAQTASCCNAIKHTYSCNRSQLYLLLHSFYSFNISLFHLWKCFSNN